MHLQIEQKPQSSKMQSKEGYHEISGTPTELAGLVVQSVMSATDMLGYRDVLGLSATDPCLRQWISIRTICPRMLACHYNRCW